MSKRGLVALGLLALSAWVYGRRIQHVPMYPAPVTGPRLHLVPVS